MSLEPFEKCNESCPLFGIVNETPKGTIYGCFIGDEKMFNVEYGRKCSRALNLKEKREFLKKQRKLERERDDITTKIYHLQLLIDNCGSE